MQAVVAPAQARLHKGKGELEETAHSHHLTDWITGRSVGMTGRAWQKGSVSFFSATFYESVASLVGELPFVCPRAFLDFLIPSVLSLLQPSLPYSDLWLSKSPL